MGRAGSAAVVAGVGSRRIEDRACSMVSLLAPLGSSAFCQARNAARMACTLGGLSMTISGYSGCRRRAPMLRAPGVDDVAPCAHVEQCTLALAEHHLAGEVGIRTAEYCGYRGALVHGLMPCPLPDGGRFVTCAQLFARCSLGWTCR